MSNINSFPIPTTPLTAIGVTPYASYADFIAETVSAPVLAASYQVGDATYQVVRDPSGPIQQANGQRWRPDGEPHPQHFGGAGDGVADDTAAVQAAIDYAGTELATGQNNINTVEAQITSWMGRFRLTSTIYWRNNVSAVMAGGGACRFLIDHTGVGFQVGPDNTTDPFWANVQLGGFTVQPLQAADTAILVRNCIRNCGAKNITITRLDNDPLTPRFRDHWQFERTWTFVLYDCMNIGASRHAAYITTQSGEIVLHGGRYDVSGDFGVFCDAPNAEITVLGAAIQFSTKGAIKTTNGLSVSVIDAFLEGNCILSPLEYYIDVTLGDNVRTSFVLQNTVLNDLNDADRTGAGVAKITGADRVFWRPRWTRNSASQIPVIDGTARQTDMFIPTSAELTDSVANISPTSDRFARIVQRSRPAQFYGIDMDGGSTVAPRLRSAAIFGLPTIGLALGTFDSIPALQGFGASDRIHLNPHNGELRFGQAGARMLDGSNEFQGRLRSDAQITASNIVPAATTGFVGVDTSGGNRTVTMTNIPCISGRQLIVTKTSDDSNRLRITADPVGETINGLTEYDMNNPNQSVILIATNTGWHVAAGFG